MKRYGIVLKLVLGNFPTIIDIDKTNIITVLLHGILNPQIFFNLPDKLLSNSKKKIYIKKNTFYGFLNRFLISIWDIVLSVRYYVC
jgi:hypothetical protein